MLLSPVAGVYISLLSYKEEKASLTPVEDFIAKADGYESTLLKGFMAALLADKHRLTEAHKLALRQLSTMICSLDGYIDKHLSPVRSCY